MESGNPSCFPQLTLRDLIWIRVYRAKLRNEEFQKENAILELKVEQAKREFLLLCDLREILFAQLDYGNNICARERAYYSLPSMKAYGIRGNTQTPPVPTPQTPEEAKKLLKSLFQKPRQSKEEEKKEK